MHSNEVICHFYIQEAVLLIFIYSLYFEIFQQDAYFPFRLFLAFQYRLNTVVQHDNHEIQVLKVPPCTFANNEFFGM